MRIIGYTPKAPDEQVATVERYYDRTTRSWIVMRKNAAGDQLGDAYYTGRRSDAEHTERAWRAENGLSQINKK